jgi:hypothetical protein
MWVQGARKARKPLFGAVRDRHHRTMFRAACTAKLRNKDCRLVCAAYWMIWTT